MTAQRIRIYTEIATLLTISIVAGLFGVKTARELWFEKRQPSTKDFNLRIQAGDRAPSIPGVNYGTKGRTVVFALSTNCRFCEENLPLYREAILASRRTERFKVVLAFPQEASDIDAFLARGGLTNAAAQSVVIARVDFGKIGIRATPTALVVGQEGLVRRTKVGKFNPEDGVRLIRDLQEVGSGT